MYFPSAPISYAVEITFACNNFCPGCANVLEANRQEVLLDWKTLFDKIAPPENRHQYAELIRITGGEPTLHPQFQEIIEYVDSLGIPFAILTNGRWPHPDKTLDILQKSHNLVGVLVSLHGSNASGHDAFLGDNNGAFKQICSTIQRSAHVGLEVFTSTVLTKYNCEQIEDILILSQKLGATYALFNRYLGEPHPIEPTEAQLHHAIRLIEKLHHEGVSCRLGDCIPPCFEKNSSLGATGGIEHCAVSPKGFVRPDNLTSYVFGNLFEQSIEEIWQSEKAQWYRGQIPEKCLECVELSRCRGGARSVTLEYGLEGDRLMKEPIRQKNLETLELDPEWKPVPYFTVRKEPFGYLLCRLNWSVPVTSEAKPIIDTLDGKITLSELHHQFGEGVLDFLGYLYQEDCIGFE